MKAALLHAPRAVSDRPLTIGDLPKPQPGAGQVLLRVRACGVCRTDLHIVEGELPSLRDPLVPGHQIVGEVVDGATSEFPAGSRVGVSWIGGVDGTCPYCRLGLENLCDFPTFTGYSVNGGYAEFAVARADFLFSLPQGLDDLSAAPLLCAGIIGFRSLRVAGVQAGGASRAFWIRIFSPPGAARVALLGMSGLCEHPRLFASRTGVVARRNVGR